MVARLRGKDEAPPEYGPGREEFTIEIHHGGFFVGFDHLRSYVDEKVAWFDQIESDTWSPLWFSDFLQHLGYESNTSIKFYWLLPGKTLADGLRVIISDHDTTVMASVVDKYKTLIVYVDHDDNMGGFNWDDVVANPVCDLPKVLSPQKVEFVDRKPGEKLPIFYTDLRKGRVDQAGPSNREHEGAHNEEIEPEEEFIDSDYDIDGGDDDLLDEDVEVDIKFLKDNKKAKGSQLKAYETSRPTQVNDDEDTDDEILELPESDGEGESRLRFKSWQEEDINNPTFFVGQVFSSVVKLREAIREYSVRNRVEILQPRNDSTRLRAHCAEGCPWNLYASMDSRVKSFVVKTYYGTHNCQKE
ncbi:unnamed protein product [Urochloa humidicola]